MAAKWEFEDNGSIENARFVHLDVMNRLSKLNGLKSVIE